MNNIACRFCGKPLNHTFADLGLSPLSNEYISQDDVMKGQHFYPLIVNVCDDCFLVQAIEFTKPQDIFSDYKYFSSYSKSWLAHCNAYVDMIVPYLGLNSQSVVTEVACNDGYLLQYFKPYGISVHGVEPSANVADAAREKGIHVVTDFFNASLAPSLIESYGKSDLIICNNVLAHVPDINGFVEGLKLILSENGTITLEFPHILKLIKYNQFDTIYHEHFSYFSIMTVEKIFEAHDLKIVKVEELETHGGSVRVYAAHAENDRISIDASVSKILNQEEDAKLNSITTYTDFDFTIKKIKRDSLKKLVEIKEYGKSIAAFGAAAKGNTFLNYCGVGKDFIDYVVDSNPHKQGLYLPGTRIPILSKSEISKTKPDYIIILPWNLSAEIEEEIKFAREWGCKFITFIPDIKIF